MVEVYVLIVLNKYFFEEGDELGLADLSVEGKMCQFIEPFIKSIGDDFSSSLILLVEGQLHA